MTCLLQTGNWKVFFMEQQIDRIYGLLATLQEGMRVVRPMVEAEHQYGIAREFLCRKLLAISKSSSVFV